MQQLYPLTADVRDALDKIFGVRHQDVFTERLPRPEEIRRAFRQKSFLYHPDRAKTLGRTEAALTKEFQKISEAYRLLSPLVREKNTRSAFVRPRPDAPRPKHAGDFYWNSSCVPPFELRFAQYLYYRGIISFQTVIRALVWQTNHRPRSGDLAKEHAALTDKEIRIVLRNKKFREPFLETARRLGFVTDPDRERILAIQRAQNCPIGRFFVEEGIVTRDELGALLVSFTRHNRKHRASQ